MLYVCVQAFVDLLAFNFRDLGGCVRLYKYFGAERISILDDCLIRFTQPEVFNDLFEFSPNVAALMSVENQKKIIDDSFATAFEDAYEKLDDNFKRVISKAQFRQKFDEYAVNVMPTLDGAIEAITPYAVQQIGAGLNKTIGVLCLSENNNSILMWGLYAESHKGFVVGYDSESTFFNQKVGPDDSLRGLAKVVYEKERLPINLSEVTEKEFFLTKSDHWEYEAEWRMILPFKDASKVVDSGGEMIYLFKYPKSAVRSVIFGARMPAGLIRKLVGEVCADEDYVGVEFFQVKKGTAQYEVKIEKLLL